MGKTAGRRRKAAQRGRQAGSSLPSCVFSAGPLFKNRNFLLLFSAQVISLTGSGVTTVGLALFAHDLVPGDSAAAVIGNALMLRILAFLMFSQPAGVLADQLHRKRLLIVADLARCALMALFPWVQSVWQVYVMIFLINVATAFFTPVYDSTIPDVAGREHYVKALSLGRVTADMEAVASPALAAALVALFGLKWLFWFDAVTYLVSAALVAASVLPRRPAAAFQVRFRTLFQELTHGTRLLWREAALRRALLFGIADAIAGAAAIVASVVYVRDELGLGENEFVVAMVALGLGSTTTAMVLGKATGRYESRANGPSELHGRRHRWSDGALLLGGTVLGLLLLPGICLPPLPVFAALWFMNGAGQALIEISSATLLAEHTQAGQRGRAYAAHFALTHAFWLVTYPAIGHGVSKLGSPLTFTLAGMACLVIVVAGILSRKPHHDHAHT
ncbi:MFS transporter [Methylolobus aquaticus]|nr:MFS transporter [Methylolobus aquaticus]